MSESKKIAILLGSGRQNSNTAGMSLWLQSLAATIFPPTTTISVIDTTSPFFPSGVLSDAVMPALIRDPKLYAEELTRAWSTFVTSCDGFIVLTPQYNWGYPGSLKNALDHLYWEWKGKPVMIATFGGHGGGKCAAQLTEVMEGGLKMKVVSRSAITLPREYIREDARVKKSEDGSFDGWLKEYEEGTKGALEQFWKGVLEPPAPAEEERRRG